MAAAPSSVSTTLLTPETNVSDLQYEILKNQLVNSYHKDFINTVINGGKSPQELIKEIDDLNLKLSKLKTDTSVSGLLPTNPTKPTKTETKLIVQIIELQKKLLKFDEYVSNKFTEEQKKIDLARNINNILDYSNIRTKAKPESFLNLFKLIEEKEPSISDDELDNEALLKYNSF